MADYSTFSDEELQQFMGAGDSCAYIEIYHRYKWLLHKHAYKILGDREDANDVVQELFTTLWNNKSIKIETNLSGYLYQGIRNRVINVIAHRQVQSKHLNSLSAFISKGECITDHLVRERQLARIIEKEIASLPPKMREVFEMSRKQYFSHKEIANKLNLSEQTVRTQVRNALRILKAKLGVLLFFYTLSIIF